MVRLLVGSSGRQQGGQVAVGSRVVRLPEGSSGRQQGGQVACRVVRWAAEWAACLLGRQVGSKVVRLPVGSSERHFKFASV